MTGPTPVNIRCTIDDPDGPRVSAPDTGSHDNAPTVRTCQVLVKVPIVEFSGELVNYTIRACAGGVDDHDASWKRNCLVFLKRPPRTKSAFLIGATQLENFEREREPFLSFFVPRSSVKISNCVTPILLR